MIVYCLCAANLLRIAVLCSWLCRFALWCFMCHEFLDFVFALYFFMAHSFFACIVFDHVTCLCFCAHCTDSVHDVLTVSVLIAELLLKLLCVFFDIDFCCGIEHRQHVHGDQLSFSLKNRAWSRWTKTKRLSQSLASQSDQRSAWARDVSCRLRSAIALRHNLRKFQIISNANVAGKN